MSHVPAGRLLLLHCLSEWGCPAGLVAQLTLPQPSSRAVLLALCWLIAHAQLFDRALQQLQLPQHLLPLLPPYSQVCMRMRHRCTYTQGHIWLRCLVMRCLVLQHMLLIHAVCCVLADLLHCCWVPDASPASCQGLSYSSSMHIMCLISSLVPHEPLATLWVAPLFS